MTQAQSDEWGHMCDVCMEPGDERRLRPLLNKRGDATYMMCQECYEYFQMRENMTPEELRREQEMIDEHVAECQGI